MKTPWTVKKYLDYAAILDADGEVIAIGAAPTITELVNKFTRLEEIDQRAKKFLKLIVEGMDVFDINKNGGS